MRLKQRMKVLLPQPDGPMNAVTKFLRTWSVDALEREVAAVADGEAGDVEHHLAPAAVDRLLGGELADPAGVDARARRGDVVVSPIAVSVPRTRLGRAWGADW